MGVLFFSGTILRLLLWWLARPFSGPAAPDPIVKRFRRARSRALARGWAIPPELPPAAAAAWLREHAGADAEPLARLAELLYRSRYGGEEVSAEEVEAAFRGARSIPRR